MPQKRSTLLWILGIVIFVGLPLVIYLLTGGYIQGEEFSPDDFSRRRFTYNVMPWFGTCLQGIEYRDKTGMFEQSLLSDGLIKKPPGKKLWHLCNDSVSDPESRDFDARLLVRFLNLTNEERESIWFNWNEDFPDTAAEMWPIVAGMARNYMYVDVVDILLRAKSLTEEGESEFRDYLKKHSSESFLREAQALEAEGDIQTACKLYAKSNEILQTGDAVEGLTRCGSTDSTNSAEVTAAEQDGEGDPSDE